MTWFWKDTGWWDIVLISLSDSAVRLKEKSFTMAVRICTSRFRECFTAKQLKTDRNISLARLSLEADATTLRYTL